MDYMYVEIALPKVTIEKFNELTQMTAKDICKKYGFKPNQTLSNSVMFYDGIEAKINLTIPLDEEWYPTTDITLYKEGKEIKHNLYTNKRLYEGEWVVEYEEKKYIVDVKSEYNSQQSIITELAAYKEAEKQGLLIRLPCKVGDTVYEISLVEPYRNPPIREMGVVDILLRDDDMYFTLQDLHDEYYDNSILSTEIGKTVFLTEEEAEQALDKMKGE